MIVALWDAPSFSVLSVMITICLNLSPLGCQAGNAPEKIKNSALAERPGGGRSICILHLVVLLMVNHHELDPGRLKTETLQIPLAG